MEKNELGVKQCTYRTGNLMPVKNPPDPTPPGIHPTGSNNPDQLVDQGSSGLGMGRLGSDAIWCVYGWRYTSVNLQGRAVESSDFLRYC